MDRYDLSFRENIIAASWFALADAVDYKLHKDQGILK